MALSEHEERMLKELERALYADDPRFAGNIRDGWSQGIRSPKSALFALLMVAGFAAIIAGVAIPFTIVGILGFVMVLGGLYGLVTAMRAASSKQAPADAAKPKKSSKGGFLDRADERFRQRRDGNGHDC